MKTNLILFLLFMGLVWQAEAQEKSHFIRLTTGFSLPSGEYGDKSNLSSSDFAHQGFTAGLQGAYFLHKNLGLMVSGSWASHPFDEDAYKEAYTRTYNQGFRLHLEANSYQISTISLGPIVQFSLSKSLKLNSHLTGGILNSRSPHIEYGEIGNFNEYGDKKQSAFLWQAGVEGVWQFSKHWGTFLQVNYQSSKLKDSYFDTMTVASQKVRIINFLSGIQYQF
jgi:hypothetical protein